MLEWVLLGIELYNIVILDLFWKRGLVLPIGISLTIINV
jgi:hypothetical protein